MRNGDVYKIQGMVKAGASEKEVLERFKHDYPADEVKKFIPKAAAKKKAVKTDPLG